MSRRAQESEDVCIVVLMANCRMLAEHALWSVVVIRVVLGMGGLAMRRGAELDSPLVLLAGLL